MRGQRARGGGAVDDHDARAVGGHVPHRVVAERLPEPPLPRQAVHAERQGHRLPAREYAYDRVGDRRPVGRRPEQRRVRDAPGVAVGVRRDPHHDLRPVGRPRERPQPGQGRRRPGRQTRGPGGPASPVEQRDPVVQGVGDHEALPGPAEAARLAELAGPSPSAPKLLTRRPEAEISWTNGSTESST